MNKQPYMGEDDYLETYENATLEKHFVVYRKQTYCLNRVYHDRKLLLENIFNSKGYIVTNPITYNAIVERA